MDAFSFSKHTVNFSRFLGILIFMSLTLSSFAQLPASQNKSKPSGEQTLYNPSSNKLRNFSDFFKHYDQEFKDCKSLLKALNQWIYIYQETADRALAGNTRAQQSIRVYATEHSPFQHIMVKEIRKFSKVCPDELDEFFEKHTYNIEHRQNLLRTRFGY